MANIFMFSADPHTVHFWEIWRHSPSLNIFVSHCLLHVKHSPTCKSMKLLTFGNNAQHLGQPPCARTGILIEQSVLGSLPL